MTARGLQAAVREMHGATRERPSTPRAVELQPVG
jgi:hypothetical protein